MGLIQTDLGNQQDKNLSNTSPANSPVSFTRVTPAEENKVTIDFTSNPNSFSGSAFGFLYKENPFSWRREGEYPDIFKRVIVPQVMKGSTFRSIGEETKFGVTKLTKYNPYYVKTNSKTPDNKWGYSTACYVDKADRKEMWRGRPADYYKSLGAQLDLPSSTHSVLPNCVGYVNGRSQEVWNLALSSGYLVKVGNTYRIPSRGNLEVPPFLGVPACNAYSFRLKNLYNNVNYPGYGRSKHPVPGAIVCWRNGWSSNGQPGHVGFVEAVYNQGTWEEYCIVTESGWCQLGMEQVVWSERIYAKHNYRCEIWGRYPLASEGGFLISPVCMLAASGGTGGSVTITDPREITNEEREALDDLYSQFDGSTKVLTELDVNQKVEIQWFGYKSPDKKSKRINKLGCYAVIIKKDLSQPCPYALSFDNKTIFGYYERTAIKPADDKPNEFEPWWRR